MYRAHLVVEPTALCRQLHGKIGIAYLRRDLLCQDFLQQPHLLNRGCSHPDIHLLESVDPGLQLQQIFQRDPSDCRGH